MPKKIPDIPKDFKRPTVDDGRSYEIELITPMFGGGVETRVSDPSFPIRPTAIRGQLQFWWRATVGARYATLTELRAAQTEVWGSTERASRVQVLIENPTADKPEPCAQFKKTCIYVLFPFKDDPASCIRSASFRLSLRCPESLWPQVEPAVWAWVNFGGLGSRTRRGCGAIGQKVEVDSSGKTIRTLTGALKDLVPKDAADLAAKWKKFMPSSFPAREWPTIAEYILVNKETNDAISAWDQVIKSLRHFRQGVRLGRNAGQKQGRPGRSRFSEPETIRRVTGQRSSQHARLSQIPDDAFPRAELGLPIVFHFQGQGEPPDTVLYPSAGLDDQKRERMASPLILKPLALQNGKAIPLILRLRTPDLADVDLRIKKKDLTSLTPALANQIRQTMQPNENEGSVPLPDPTDIRDPRLSSYPNSPLQGSPTGSALDAFLAFARSEGFTEVTR